MKKIGLLMSFVVLAAIAVAWRLQSAQLYVNGNLASTGMIERNGVAYVPLKDVATALKLTIQKTSRGYELSDAGGSNQVEGITGKVGDVLFNGYVRFQVIKVTRVKTYHTQFDGANRDMTPIPESNEFVVILCRVKNGVPKTVYMNPTGGLTTSVTDTDGHSYTPRRFSDDPPNQDLLPGAAMDFALVTDIPPSAKLQDLVFEAAITGAPQSEKKKFRVSLATP